MSLLLRLLPLFFLVSCGFSPVYKQSAGNDSLHKTLYSIYIPPIQEKFGQELRNRLRDSLDPTERGTSYDYRLEVSLKKEVNPSVIEQDRRITRYNMNQTAFYRLLDTKTGKELTSGSVRNSAGFDAPKSSEFAVYTAEDDSGTRVAGELAKDIEQRIIAFLIGYTQNKQ